MARYDFASDNTAPAAPEAIEALVAANTGFTSGYGTDAVSARAADAVRALLDADAEVRFVASGTAANAIALATLCRPFEAVLAHEHAHVCTDETGAPGFFGQGLGLVGLPGASGRIDPAALAAPLTQPDMAHRQFPVALSLTNATEYGTVYSVEELAALTAPVKAKGLGVHLDGARLANAAAAGFDLKAIGSLGVDILVVGGTKAGMTATEAVVIFDRALARRFDARLKQSGQLPSRAASTPPRSSACWRAAPSSPAPSTPTPWLAGWPSCRRSRSPIRSKPTPCSSRWTMRRLAASTPPAGSPIDSSTARCASCARGPSPRTASRNSARRSRPSPDRPIPRALRPRLPRVTSVSHSPHLKAI